MWGTGGGVRTWPGRRPSELVVGRVVGRAAHPRRHASCAPASGSCPTTAVTPPPCQHKLGFLGEQSIGETSLVKRSRWILQQSKRLPSAPTFPSRRCHGGRRSVRPSCGPFTKRIRTRNRASHRVGPRNGLPEDVRQARAQRQGARGPMLPKLRPASMVVAGTVAR